MGGLGNEFVEKRFCVCLKLRLRKLFYKKSLPKAIGRCRSGSVNSTRKIGVVCFCGVGVPG